jgi:adenine/guanine phosphoribosyltransferase-like PRPP-binding protein
MTTMTDAPRPGPAAPTAPGDDTPRPTYTVTLGTQTVDVPIVEVAPDVGIALFITFDNGVGLLERAGAELAQRLAPHRPDIIATNATCGIPVAMEVSRALGLDDYLVLQKTKKIHLADAITRPLRSITTDTDQELRLDRARRHLVEGRRVVVVDDVISTGTSIRAANELVREAGGDLVAIGVLLVEGTDWHDLLGEDAGLVESLGSIPVFHRTDDGWAPRPG